MSPKFRAEHYVRLMTLAKKLDEKFEGTPIQNKVNELFEDGVAQVVVVDHDAERTNVALEMMEVVKLSMVYGAFINVNVVEGVLLGTHLKKTTFNSNFALGGV